jgi:hypothetical protein
MSTELAESVRGRRVGAVGNCFELAPWADFLAANDSAWWRAHPAAHQFAGRKFSCNDVAGVERCAMGSCSWNSGVLALQVAVLLGARRIELHGFDMQGTHFFGPYTNGLANTAPARRQIHFYQYARWAAANPHVDVVNRTPGSALTCFRFE